MVFLDAVPLLTLEYCNSSNSFYEQQIWRDPKKVAVLRWLQQAGHAFLVHHGLGVQGVSPLE